MNIYDEALLSIEALPHSIKVPLRKLLKRAKKEFVLLEQYRLLKYKLTHQEKAYYLFDVIDNLEKELEGKLK